jgi:hypothetical protein
MNLTDRTSVALRGPSLVALALLLGALAYTLFHLAIMYVYDAPAAASWTEIAGELILQAGAIILGVVAIALFLVGCIRWALVDEYRQRVESLEGKLSATNDHLKQISARLLISDVAKRITGRDQDRQALRQAIEEDLTRGDFDAALVLVNEMARTYGYALEAEEFRDRIQNARAASLNARIAESMVGFEKLLADAEWDKAHAEAAKLHRLYPDAVQVRDLPRRVKEAWQARKHDLERSLLQSASHDDVEGAMEALRELDRYLTPQEAAPFLEVARGVIGKKRQNLGVQFKLAIQDREWTQAVAVGEQIIREFPNTKMADEVRSTIDILRERAAGQRAAERSASPVS